jgi:hypothetical protein
MEDEVPAWDVDWECVPALAGARGERRRCDDDPLARFYAAILESAWRDLRSRRKAERTDARRWLAGNCNCTVTLDQVCTALDLDARRRRMLSALAGH